MSATKLWKLFFWGTIDDVEMQIYVSNHLRSRTTFYCVCDIVLVGIHWISFVFPVCTSAYISRTQYSAVEFIRDSITIAPHCTNSFIQLNVFHTSASNLRLVTRVKCFVTVFYTTKLSYIRNICFGTKYSNQLILIVVHSVFHYIHTWTQ